METGGQYAMITGPQWIQMLPADSQDTLALVCKEQSSYLCAVTDCVVPSHRFNTLFQRTLWTKQ